MRYFAGAFILMPILLFACGATYLSDEAGIPTDTIFTSSDFLYLTGDLDRTNPPYEIFPTADIYIMRNYGFSASQEFPLWDDEGSKNTVVGTIFPGSYIGELIAMPPLPEGKYDIVVDEDQDGTFNPGIDCLLGDGREYAFRVINAGEMPEWLTLELERIKSRAAQESLAARRAALNFALGLQVTGWIGVVLSFWSDGVLIGCINAAAQILGIPLSYNDAIIQLGQPIVTGLLEAQGEHYAGIARDPIDTSYYSIQPLPATTFFTADADHPLAQYQARFANSIAIQNSALYGILRTMEKFEGAKNDHENLAQRTQARGIRKYALLWKKGYTLAIASIDSMKAYIIANGLNRNFSRSLIQSVKNRVASEGFTSEEIEGFNLYGVSDAQRDTIRNRLLTIDTSLVFNGSFLAYLDSLKSELSKTALVIDSLRLDAQELIDSLSAPFGVDNERGSPIVEPEAVITGDSVLSPGSSAALVATDSIANFPTSTIEWDTDGDGVFCDGTGPSISYTPDEEGYHLVGVKITNSIGMIDYGYLVVEARIGNRAPVINSFSPETVFVNMPYTGTVNFGVYAVDPEGDPINYLWSLDGSVVSNTNGYTYSPGISGVGFHNLKVIVGDNNPNSNDAGVQWRIRVYNPLEISAEANIPRGFELTAYPNPFNANLNLRLQMPFAGKVEIGLYNMLGERIYYTTIPNLQQGTQTFVVDASNIPTGVYFVRADLGPFGDTRRVVLIK